MVQMTRRGQLTTAAVSKDAHYFICHQGDGLPYLHSPYSNNKEVNTAIKNSKLIKYNSISHCNK